MFACLKPLLTPLVFHSLLCVNRPLRIDNSGRSVIYTFDHKSETVLVLITCYIPNKRLYFSLSFGISAFIIKCDFRMF